MKNLMRITVLLVMVLAFLAAVSPASASTTSKVPTANPTFTSGRGQRVSGTYANVQTDDGTYMRLRETRSYTWNPYRLDSYWSGWQSFTEAARGKLLDIRIDLIGYQTNTQTPAESWYVRFYNYDTAAWDSTWYALGSLPYATPDGALTVSLGDRTLARRFVSTAGAFRLRLADGHTVNGGSDTRQTNLYIDQLKATFFYDVTPPASSVTAPANGELTSAHSYTVTGTATDPTPEASGVTAVGVSTNGGSSWNAATLSVPGGISTNWSYAWTIPAEGTYNIRSRATDEAGNVETPGSGVNLTVDWTPPVVSGTSPVSGQANVAVTAGMQATFTEAYGMNAGTINASTFTVKDGGGAAVTGSVSYDPGSMTASFAPTADLSYGTSYTATLTTGITDQAGNPLASDYSWTFTTAPAPPDYVYADNPGWQTTGTWDLERYTQLPPPDTGPHDLLTANDAGATASFTVPAGYTRLQVASSEYWTCGMVDVYLDGVLVVDDFDLISEETTWGNVIYSNNALDPSVAHTLTLEATGTGGPGIVYFDGVPYDFS